MKTENITLSTDDKIALMISLATMLSAGITLMEAIDSLLEDVKGNQKKILLTVKEDILQGKRLYTALSKFPAVFDNVTINIIKAAEETKAGLVAMSTHGRSGISRWALGSVTDKVLRHGGNIPILTVKAPKEAKKT